MILVESSYSGQYSLLAGITLLVWDTLLTLDEEVRFIWTFQFTVAKILYLTVRYLVLMIFCALVLAFFGNYKQFDGLCPAIPWIICVGGSFTIACSNVLLVHRVYAFYGRSRRILWFLFLLFISTEAAAIIVLVLSVTGFLVLPSQGDVLPPSSSACAIQQYPEKLSFVFFSELIFQSLAFVCVVARFIKLQSRARRTDVPYSPLYQKFFRDGIWVFTILFLTFLLSGIYMHTSTSDVSGPTLSLWSYAASSICCTRLILNLNYSAKGHRNDNEY